MLVIGIDEYQSISPLQNAVRDAKAVADILLSKYSFDHELTIELYNEKATHEDIIGALDLLADKVNEEDNLLIYYAGHGLL